MKTKYLFGLLVAVSMVAGSVLAQQPAPAPDPVEPFEHNFSFFIDGGGYLGVYAENINRENMGRYRMSQPRGVGVTQVVKDSPAEKAGIKKDDVILRVDGDNVTSVRKLNRLVSEIAPDQSVRVTISRAGSEQEITATIGKRMNTMASELLTGEPRVWSWGGSLNREGLADKDGDLTILLGNSRRIGVSTTELTKQLAEFFGITSGRGVLVTSVVEDGPAAKSGIKAGDVITAVDGEAVESTGDISRAINRKKEGDVTLTVIRNKAQQTIRVTPQEGRRAGSLPRADGGRRIVIPRIDIPEVDISMPRIVIPAIPSINIDMPRVRVAPRVRVRSVHGPI
jgi:serine protease Do